MWYVHLCACMYVCVYVCSIYIHVCMYVRMYVYIYMYVRMYVCIIHLCVSSMRVCIYVCVFMYACIYVCIYVCHNCTGNIIEGPSNFTYLPNVTTLPIELTCNVSGVALWEINGTDYALSSLTEGDLSGHSRSGTNILVDNPLNNTEYICESQTNDGGVSSDPAYIIIAGV